MSSPDMSEVDGIEKILDSLLSGERIGVYDPLVKGMAEVGLFAIDQVTPPSCLSPAELQVLNEESDKLFGPHRRLGIRAKNGNGVERKAYGIRLRDVEENMRILEMFTTVPD